MKKMGVIIWHHMEKQEKEQKNENKDECIRACA
jgi:hypothetical protein